MNEDDAQSAISNMHGLSIGDKSLFVSIANPNAQTAPMVNRNVYLAGIPLSYSEDDLVSVFSKFGLLDEAKILSDRHSDLSRGIGFVRFSTLEGSAGAIQHMNGVYLEGGTQPLVVKYARPKTMQQQQQQNNSLSLSSSPLHPSLSLSHGHHHHHHHHHSSEPHSRSSSRNSNLSRSSPPPLLPPPSSSSSSSQFYSGGFQNGSSSMIGERERDLRSSPIAMGGPPASTLSLSSPPQPHLPTSSSSSSSSPSSLPHHSLGFDLFVCYIPQNFDEDSIFSLFSQAGNVTQCKVVRDATTGESKCYGFVSMADRQSATRAVSSLNGYHIAGKRLKVTFNVKKDGGEEMNGGRERERYGINTSSLSSSSSSIPLSLPSSSPSSSSSNMYGMPSMPPRGYGHHPSLPLPPHPLSFGPTHLQHPQMYGAGSHNYPLQPHPLQYQNGTPFPSLSSSSSSSSSSPSLSSSLPPSQQPYGAHTHSHPQGGGVSFAAIPSNYIPPPHHPSLSQAHPGQQQQQGQGQVQGQGPQTSQTPQDGGEESDRSLSPSSLTLSGSDLTCENNPPGTQPPPPHLKTNMEVDHDHANNLLPTSLLSP